MAQTREASQRNLTEIFNRVVAEFQGKIKIEATYPQWSEPRGAGTLAPKLHFYLQGSSEPHDIEFTRALFDDCAKKSRAEQLSKAEGIIRRELDLLIYSSYSSHP